MKYLIMFLFCFCVLSQSQAQTITGDHLTRSNALKFKIGLNNTVHVISPEPISYVDISDPKVEGDITEKKLCRIKASKLNIGDRFTVTVVTPTFMSVYEFTCSADNPVMETVVVTINPMEAISINRQGYLTESDFSQLALYALKTPRRIYNLQAADYDLHLFVNNIYIVGDYLLLDMGIKNKSSLAVDLEQVKFTIKDVKQLKATVSQDVPIDVAYRLYNDETLRLSKSYRNFYFLKKFTFPAGKVLSIELTEKQISGRKVTLHIDYNQILKATPIN